MADTLAELSPYGTDSCHLLPSHVKIQEASNMNIAAIDSRNMLDASFYWI
jgi:hypothetical protein